MSFTVRNINNLDQAGKNFGEGVGEGYMQGSDERTIRKAVESLPPNASYRDILNAVSGASVYNPKTKQQVLENYVKSHELELTEKKLAAQEEANRIKSKAQSEKDRIAEERLKEAQRHNQAVEATNAAKLTGKKEENDAKAARAEDEVKTVLKAKGYPDNLVEQYAPTLTPQSARSLEPHDKEQYNRDYTKAQNQAKPYEKRLQNIYEKAAEAPGIMARQKVAIQNNEQYGADEKLWDVALETLNSPFANQFKSKRGQELTAIGPIAIASLADKMGGVLTNRKIAVLETKVAGIGKDKNANRLFLHMDFYDQLLNREQARFAQEIVAENPYGLPPVDFAQQLDERMKPLRDQIDRDIDVLLKDKIPHSWVSPEVNRKPLKEGNVYVRNKATGQTGQISQAELKDYPQWEIDDAANSR